jgi:hypothetical protein
LHNAGTEYSVPASCDNILPFNNFVSIRGDINTQYFFAFFLLLCSLLKHRKNPEIMMAQPINQEGAAHTYSKCFGLLGEI